MKVLRIWGLTQKELWTTVVQSSFLLQEKYGPRWSIVGAQKSMDHGGPYFWRTGDERRADAGLNDSSLSDDLVEIGERVRKRRIYLHLSQEQLAEKAKISVNTVSRIECGQAAMSIDKFVRILRALRADANEMIGPRILEEAGSKSTESLFIRFRHLEESDREIVIQVIKALLDALEHKP